jgi:hypothetical protein
MTVFAPREEAFAKLADEYGSPARLDQAAAAAKADVANAYEAQWAANKADMESQGIDPSQGRFQGAAALRRLSADRSWARSSSSAARRVQELASIGLKESSISAGV